IVLLIFRTLGDQEGGAFGNLHRTYPVQPVTHIEALSHQKFRGVLFRAVLLVGLVVDAPHHAVIFLVRKDVRYTGDSVRTVKCGATVRDDLDGTLSNTRQERRDGTVIDLAPSIHKRQGTLGAQTPQ